MKKSENIRELERLASSQWGLFTTAQSAAIGVGRTQIARMEGAGTIECVRRGTYRYVVGEETAHVHVKAAWLAAYPKLTAVDRMRMRPFDAVVAGPTAAFLHGIGDLHEDPYTFIVRTRRQTVMADLAFHAAPLDDADVTFVGTLPVTTMERTVVDLVRGRHDPSHVERAARDALRKGADARRMQSLLEGLAPRYAASAGLLLPLVSKAAEYRENEEILIEAMRELEEIFRKELPSRPPKPGTPRHEAFEAAIAKFDRVALGAASPAIAEAARSLSESAHALMDTPFDT